MEASIRRRNYMVAPRCDIVNAHFTRATRGIDFNQPIRIHSNNCRFIMDKNTIFEKVKELLISEFKAQGDSIKLEKRLDDDLDLDSLDMVDLIICLKDYIGDKVDPALFKNARTVENVVDLLQPLWRT